MNDTYMNCENNRGILLFSNRKYLFALGAFLLNLQEYVSYDGVVIYHDGFTEGEQEAIRKIEPKVKFIKYGLDEFVQEFGFDKEKIQSYFFIKRYTVLSVIKFKIFELLQEFSTVILFDLDMILQGEIDDLLEKDFDIAWRNDNQNIRDKLSRWQVSDNLLKEIGMYDVYKKVMTPNGGFFAVKRTFDYLRVYEECVNYLHDFSFLHPFSIDEVMFAYISEKMKLNVHYVNARIYNVFPIHVNMKSRLIHFLGDYKPWNNSMSQAIFRGWRRNYEKYLALTNMPSTEVKDYSNISERLVQARYIRMWGELFTKHHFIYPAELKLDSDMSASSLVFSYYGFLTYKIETSWLMAGVYCVFWLDKKNIIIPVQAWQNKLQYLVKINDGRLTYHENEKGFGIKTANRLIRDIPDEFYRIYDLTDSFRKLSRTCFARMTTYHGTKLYLDLKKLILTHAKESLHEEVYAAVNGKRVALFISRTGVNIYLKSIGKDGEVSLSSLQTFFACFHNADHSISIEVYDGGMLSADKNGKITLRHWKREWEHFHMENIGSINE